MSAELVVPVRDHVTVRRPGAARLSRARGVVAYWKGDQLVLENFMASTRVAAPAVAIRVLDQCGTPQTVTSVVRALPEFSPVDVRRLIGDLRRLKMLERWEPERHAAPVEPDGWEGWNPAAGFFHFSTKDVAFPKSPDAAAKLWDQFGPDRPMPPPLKTYPGAGRVALPRVAEPNLFSTVLLKRRTWREFSRTAINLDQLSTVLHLTWGVQQWAPVRGGKVALKTSPSGGARHSGEVYVLARRVSGLKAGVYHYDPSNRSLTALPSRTPVPAVADLLPGQPWYRQAPVLFIMTAVFARAQWRYGFPRAYRAVLIEAGHLCQTCCLVATSLGLAPFCSMAFPDTRVEAMLGLDGVKESALYIAGVGVPPQSGWRPWPQADGSSDSTEVSWLQE